MRQRTNSTTALGLLHHTCPSIAGSSRLTLALFSLRKQFAVWMHVFVCKITADSDQSATWVLSKSEVRGPGSAVRCWWVCLLEMDLFWDSQQYSIYNRNIPGVHSGTNDIWRRSKNIKCTTLCFLENVKLLVDRDCLNWFVLDQTAWMLLHLIPAWGHVWIAEGIIISGNSYSQVPKSRKKTKASTAVLWMKAVTLQGQTNKGRPTDKQTDCRSYFNMWYALLTISNVR